MKQIEQGEGNKSAVAQMREEIRIEIEAMMHGFSAYAAGIARHQFIREKSERLGEIGDKLKVLVGEEPANTIIGTIYIEQAECNSNNAIN